MNDEAKVYVVDDDEAVLLSVRAILSEHGYSVECFLTAERFLAAGPPDEPGCVITDIQMPEINGVELQRRLLAANSILSVVVVTGVADVPTAVTLMENGAITLLEKPYNHADLLGAVERATDQSRERWQRHHDTFAATQRLATLSAEERCVLDLMVAGKPNKAIAHRLKLGMRTVDRRRQSVLEKMGVKTVPELALLLGTMNLAPTVTESVNP